VSGREEEAAARRPLEQAIIDEVLVRIIHVPML
jgi:hypothetical protein